MVYLKFGGITVVVKLPENEQGKEREDEKEEEERWSESLSPSHETRGDNEMVLGDGDRLTDRKR
jgi:hypothetical protein